MWLRQAVRRRAACLFLGGWRVIRRLQDAACLLGFLVLIPLAAATQAVAHDPSMYGGAFRSRGMGGSWLNADVGLFLNAALIVAVDPRDPNHLLMGSDAGLFNSVNGGRSWTQEVPALISGPAFAVAFSPDGTAALCVTPRGVYRGLDGTWRRSDAPAGATPARDVVFGAARGRVYLLGQGRLFSSNDGGASFVPVPGDADGFETLAIARRPVETLFAVVHGHLMSSHDGGQGWQQRPVTGTSGPVDTVIPDPTVANRVWVAVADRLYASNDGGLHWLPAGSQLPEARTVVRGIAADPAATMLVVTTHRGTYRSTDAGVNWTLEERNLPVHLEAGPLTRDPEDPSILYVVYSLIPYPEIWRGALDGSNLLARADPASLIGGVAFLLLLLLTGVAMVAWLVRGRRDIPGALR